MIYLLQYEIIVFHIIYEWNDPGHEDQFYFSDFQGGVNNILGGDNYIIK